MDKIKKLKEIGELVGIAGSIAGLVIKGVASVIAILSNGESVTLQNFITEVTSE